MYCPQIAGSKKSLEEMTKYKERDIITSILKFTKNTKRKRKKTKKGREKRHSCRHLQKQEKNERKAKKIRKKYKNFQKEKIYNIFCKISDKIVKETNQKYNLLKGV